MQAQPAGTTQPRGGLSLLTSWTPSFVFPHGQAMSLAALGQASLLVGAGSVPAPHHMCHHLSREATLQCSTEFSTDVSDGGLDSRIVASYGNSHLW